MMPGEIAQQVPMAESSREREKAVSGYDRFHWLFELELPDGVLDGDFPRADGTDKDKLGPLDGSNGSGPKLVEMPPDQRLEADDGVGAGVRELRIHADSEYRVLYLATRPEAVYVLHAFAKRRQRTPKLDLDLARARLKELLRRRARE